MPTITEMLNLLIEQFPIDEGAYFAFFAPTPGDESPEWEVHINHTALNEEDNPMYWSKSADIEEAARLAWTAYQAESVE